MLSIDRIKIFSDLPASLVERAAIGRMLEKTAVPVSRIDLVLPETDVKRLNETGTVTATMAYKALAAQGFGQVRAVRDAHGEVSLVAFRGEPMERGRRLATEKLSAKDAGEIVEQNLAQWDDIVKERRAGFQKGAEAFVDYFPNTPENRSLRADTAAMVRGLNDAKAFRQFTSDVLKDAVAIAQANPRLAHILATTGKVPRSALIRALVERVKKMGVDITKAPSEFLSPTEFGEFLGQGKVIANDNVAQDAATIGYFPHPTSIHLMQLAYALQYAKAPKAWLEGLNTKNAPMLNGVRLWEQLFDNASQTKLLVSQSTVGNFLLMMGQW